MRPYSEVVIKCANRMFGQYMGGSNDLRTEGTNIIAYIYDVPEEQVIRQIIREYTKVQNNYYNTRKANALHKL